MRKTNQDITGQMYLSTFTVPKGTEVRALTPKECPQKGLFFVVVNPLRDIPEVKGNPILRHDLTHHFVFVPEWATIR
jgi:hypothetical protein